MLLEIRKQGDHDDTVIMSVGTSNLHMCKLDEIMTNQRSMVRGRALVLVFNTNDHQVVTQNLSILKYAADPESQSL